MLTGPRRDLCQQRRFTYAGLAAHRDRALAPVQASRGVPLDHPAASLCRAATAGMRHPETRVPAWELLRVSLDECEGRVGHLAPAVVDDERVTTIGKLDYLGNALVALLLLESSFGNRAGDGVVLGAFDDQEWSAVGVLGVDFGLGPRVEVLGSGLKNSLA